MSLSNNLTTLWPVPASLLRKCIGVIAMWTGILELVIGSTVLELPGAAVRSLEFKNEGFKIVLFADLHYGENAWQDWGPAQDRNSTCVMSYILDAEKPDFVIFLGDILTANNLVSPNATSYWEQAVSATKERNIPWASVFGNHDDTAFVWPSEWFGISGVPGVSEMDQYFRGVTRAELMRNDKKNILSLSMEGPKVLWPSVSNFALEVASSDSLSTAVILYFLDSGGGSYPEVISASQAIWFEAVSSDLNPHAKIPEIVFWHIPSLAYVEVSPSPNLPIKSPCVGSINFESVAPQSAEFGIMDILSKRRSVKAVFVGHNHGLDWCCPYKDLWLCFAR
eukprot:c19933_g1_i2 orf=141-1151(+)